MKIKLTTILILFTIISSTFGGAVLEYIRASNSGENIKIEWKSGSETNLRYYSVMRRPANVDSFTDIATIQPKGNNSYYSFIDNSAYKTTSTIYIYQLKIVDDKGDTYSIKVSATPNVSGVKQTWGSIKAMFR